VREELASGGMGTVYRVFDQTAGSECALKRLRTDAAGQRFAADAFRREYQVLASLDHPRIIHVFDYGVDELGPYYTMELLDGRDMRQAAPLPYQQACRYLRDVAISLALLHARRLIHRDLSPNNVRITDDDHCKLLDFGALVPFGCHDKVVGTPPLIPPEALKVASLDQRADLYSFGALAYWMLTGKHAYPAQHISELGELWSRPPRAPSALVPGIPPEMDTLVLSLLRADPRARPGSAAEISALLSAIGELPAEDTTEAERLAMSFLLNPHFMGRAQELLRLESLIRDAIQSRGGAACIEGVQGMGRTRLLEETSLRAKLAGITVIRVDATMYRELHGTTRAVVLRLIDALPELVKAHSAGYRAALAALGNTVLSRLGLATDATVGQAKAADCHSLEGWFVELAREKPLAVLVDNIDHADDASLGLLASLAKLSADNALLVVVTRQLDAETRGALGIEALRSHAKRIELSGLDQKELLELVRSLFGDPPNLKRFSQWLHGRTLGAPLHAMEITRQLVNRQVIRYSGGVWTLPVTRPDSALPAALGDVLASRLERLSESARGLAESLSLARERATFELCRLLTESTEDRHVLATLDELSRHDVLHADVDGYRFSSSAVRDALLRGMDELRLQQNHRRLGEAFAKLAGKSDPALRIEAGWHLIRGGDELRGADMIALVTHDATTVRMLVANLHRIGAMLEAALEVYNKYRRSVYQRMPLLAALAQSGFYEDRVWGERYGATALDVLEDLSGLRTARTLRRFCGKTLSLILGIFGAFLRFKLTPREERAYSFANVLVQLFGTSSTLSISAALCFDAERATCIADVLEPFAFLPARLTPVGIYEFCRSLALIPRDRQAEAYENFCALLVRFHSPRYYPTLPADARKLYVAGLHAVRGIFGTFRADGRGALESAAILETTGLKFHAMVASQIRFLYHTLRGEFAKAAPHREQVELHAAHVGSAWQVELWEAPTLMLVQALLSDVVGSTRAAHRLETLSQGIPSLSRYARLATMAYAHVIADREPALIEARNAELLTYVPRSYNGWAASMGYLARNHNGSGRYSEAKQVCERVLGFYDDAEQEYVSHYLVLHLELSHADAALGNVERAIGRIDALLERFKSSDHPLLLGLLHEVRAQIAWGIGDAAGYSWSLAEVERWFLPTGTPALIAKCRKLAELRIDFTHAPSSDAAASTTTRSETTAYEGVTSPRVATSQIVRKTDVKIS
jgi:tetratricopeptide (TPR) repeat protein